MFWCFLSFAQNLDDFYEFPNIYHFSAEIGVLFYSIFKIQYSKSIQFKKFPTNHIQILTEGVKLMPEKVCKKTDGF